MSGKIKKMLDSVLYYLSVPKCTACREPLDKSGLPLCKSCLVEYERTLNRQCSRCNKLLSRCSCTGEYLGDHRIKGHLKLFRYDNREENRAANSLIYSAKRSARTDVFDFLADELALAISSSLEDSASAVITNVPRSPRSIRKYGYDHAAILAREVAKRLGAEYTPLLKSLSKKPQKKMSREERKENARFRLVASPDLTGRTMIIIDDIVTTGASVVSAGEEIRALGKRQKIYCASVAMAYKDEYDFVEF